MKKKLIFYFKNGINTILPIIASLYILYILSLLIFTLIFELVEYFTPFLSIFEYSMLNRTLILLLVVLFVSVIGYLSKKAFVNHLIDSYNKLALRIPILKVVYMIMQKLMNKTLNHEEKLFDKITLAPFPIKGIYVIGFANQYTPDKKKNKRAVFIPTLPNISEGITLIYDKEQLINTNLNFDEAFTMLLSFTIITPARKVKGS
jgi:uncharacterized membrane protein